MRVIAVTGTPCTGKTTLAKKLAKKLNCFYLDVNELIKENKLYDGYDRKRQSYIVDVKKLNKHLIGIINFLKSLDKKSKRLKLNKNAKKGMIIDSHLSHYLPKKYVDLCIVTKYGLKALEKRLKKRKYGKVKIRENLDAEIFDVCLNEAKERGHKVTVIDATKNIKTKQISSIVEGWF